MLEQNPQLKKTWRAALKRYDAADDPTKTRLRIERSWLYTLILDFLGLLQTELGKSGTYRNPGA
jgi:intron-binding protein aquarius